MQTLIYSLLGLVVGLVIIYAAGFVIVRIMDWRQSRSYHRTMCTSYNRCPECRSQQEPPSQFDLWDRYR